MWVEEDAKETYIVCLHRAVREHRREERRREEIGLFVDLFVPAKMARFNCFSSLLIPKKKKSDVKFNLFIPISNGFLVKLSTDS